MAFKIIENESVDRWVESEEPLWLTADGERLVAEGDPEAASLFAAAGHRIGREDALRFGLVKPTKDEKQMLQAEEKAAEQTVDEILADVGDDPEKARLALEAEQGQEKPRKSLVAKLEKVAAGE